MGTQKGSKMHPKIDQKMMNFWRHFWMDFGCQNEARIDAKTSSKMCYFFIDFWRFLGHRNEAQMVMKRVPNPIVFWNIFEFIFGMIF